MQYVLQVFLADTSSLKNRALVFSFANTPYIVTTFIGPRAAQSFLDTSGWPWGYGTFAIITPVITLPILIVLHLNEKKAIKEGLLVKEKSGRSFVESVNYYFWEFDGKTPPKMSLHNANAEHSDWTCPHRSRIRPIPPALLPRLVPN